MIRGLHSLRPKLVYGYDWAGVLLPEQYPRKI